MGIILFNTVTSYSFPGKGFTFGTPFKILGSFLYLTFFSVLVGAIVGSLSSLIFKRFRVLTHSAIIECALVFCFGYLSYVVSELLELSGIMSLLVCGIFIGQFTWYNLSPQAKHTTSVTF